MGSGSASSPVDFQPDAVARQGRVARVDGRGQRPGHVLEHGRLAAARPAGDDQPIPVFEELVQSEALVPQPCDCAVSGTYTSSSGSSINWLPPRRTPRSVTRP